jgi:hypothetical protein
MLRSEEEQATVLWTTTINIMIVYLFVSEYVLFCYKFTVLSSCLLALRLWPHGARV